MKASDPLFSRLFSAELPARTPYLSHSLPWRQILWWTFLLFSAVGIYGLALRFLEGHLPAGYGSYVPWGLWIGIYFHGVGLAGGVFTLGALGYLLGWRGFADEKNLRQMIVLSVACILPAFFAVWLDLGHEWRFGNIFLHPSFSSMMAFNSWMYSAYLVVAAGIWVLSYRARGSGWLKPLICLAALFTVLFPSQSGAFFGVVGAKGHWHSPLLPLMFQLSALTAGSALLMLARILIDGSANRPLTGQELENEHAIIRRLRVVVISGIVLYFVFEFAEISIAFWNPASHAPGLHLMLFGPYWWVFWIVHLLAGGLVPLALLVSRWRAGWTIAALLTAVCFLSARLNVLIPGQAVGELKGLQEAFQDERLNYIYHATPMEYYVGLLCVAIGMAIFVIGRRINFAAHRYLDPK
ncbi:MAG TPA: NrfD/PsrC family molybdoenzyme membrane anchor subunit [Opitutaceae bacterium]